MNLDKLRLMKPPSGTLNIDDVRYPAWASIKYDGFRVGIINGKTVLNSLREVDNTYTRNMLLSVPELNMHDGELVMLPLNDNKCFNRCQSAFRAEDGQPDFRYVVFDVVSEKSFEDRWINFQKPEYPSWVIVDCPVKIENREQLDLYVSEIVGMGHEGVILRQGNSLYKFGRATMKNQEVLRIKPMEDDEATVIGFECEYENINEAGVDKHGHTKRSHSKEGLIPKDTLGKLICMHPVWGELPLSGFDDETADEIWHNKEKYLGELATFRYQKMGSLLAPRLAKFKGFRCKGDMS
jgi:DNA ligase-1